MLKKIGLFIFVCYFAIIPLHFHAYSEEFPSTLSPISLENPYQFISLLGNGEKAEVFLAENAAKQLVAIKCMYSEQQLRDSYSFTQKDLDKMFDSDGSSLIATREIFISRQLKHPHILNINSMYIMLDPTSGERRDCLVMEYVRGQTLDKTPQKSQTNQQALQNALSLIDALKFAFSKNWIHYDLYSSNLMFDENQEIKLIDLDSFDELTDSNSDVTHIEYLNAAILTLEQVLARGNFDKNSLEAISQMLRHILYHSSYSEELNQPISSQSGPLFSLVLEDMSTFLCNLQEDEQPLLQEHSSSY